VPADSDMSQADCSDGAPCRKGERAQAVIQRFRSDCRQITVHPSERKARGCRPVCRRGCGGGGTDSTRQRYARRPSAIGPSHSRARCGAWPAKARCDESAREWHAAPVANQMMLAAALGPIEWDLARSDPPYTARMEQLSTTAHDRSISHNGSGSNTAALRCSHYSLTRIRFRRFCYALQATHRTYASRAGCRTLTPGHVRRRTKGPPLHSVWHQGAIVIWSVPVTL
jgi:hypothetical protein